MTPQEIFDTVVKHLAKQGRPAFSYGDDQAYDCAYRTTDEDGAVLKCAVGCLIPDEVYQPEWEGQGIKVLIGTDATLPEWFRANTELLDLLQVVHDGWPEGKPFNTLSDCLRNVARTFDLSPSVLDEARS